jgi:hypothetical protein
MFSNYPMKELVPLLGVMEKISKAHSKPMTAGKFRATIVQLHQRDLVS